MRAGLLITGMLVSCAAPPTETWTFSAGAPTEDGCALAADAGTPPILAEARWIRTDETTSRFSWAREPDGRTTSDYACTRAGDEFGCDARRLGFDDGEFAANTWMRGTFDAENRAFTGTVTVVETCGAPRCPPPVAGPQLPCRSVFPIGGARLIEREPVACPAAGVGSTPGGAPATLTVIKESGESGLKLGELDATGGIMGGGDLPSNPGHVRENVPTTIGTWFVVYTHSGGKDWCRSAFLIDAPEVRVVLR